MNQIWFGAVHLQIPHRQQLHGALRQRTSQRARAPASRRSPSPLRSMTSHLPSQSDLGLRCSDITCVIRTRSRFPSSSASQTPTVLLPVSAVLSFVAVKRVWVHVGARAAAPPACGVDRSLPSRCCAHGSRCVQRHVCMNCHKYAARIKVSVCWASRHPNVQ